MSDTPVEAPVEPEEPEEAVQHEPEPAVLDTPAQAPTSGMWLVLTRVRYTAGPDEFFAGPGELITAQAAAQCDPDSVEEV